MKTVYKDNCIRVSEMGREYDFTAIIKNLTDSDIVVRSIDETFEDIEINPCGWIGILADSNGWDTLEAIAMNEFEVMQKYEKIMITAYRPSTSNFTPRDIIIQWAKDNNIKWGNDFLKGFYVQKGGCRYYYNEWQIFKQDNGLDKINISLIREDLI